MRKLRGREPWKFVSSVLIVSGAMLLGDAAVTLAWQEPVSAFVQSRQQAALADELEDLAARYASRGEPARPVPLAELRRRAARFAGDLDAGGAFGDIDLPAIGKSSVLIEGTGTGDLRKAPGHYPDTPVPGQRGTVGVAGHRTTWGAPFRRIDKLDRGDKIAVTMPYARVVYRVERKTIVDPTEIWVKRRVGHDRLILTACNPLYSAAQRLVVFARFDRAEER